MLLLFVWLDVIDEEPLWVCGRRLRNTFFLSVGPTVPDGAMVVHIDISSLVSCLRDSAAQNIIY